MKNKKIYYSRGIFFAMPGEYQNAISTSRVDIIADMQFYMLKRHVTSVAEMVSWFDR